MTDRKKVREGGYLKTAPEPEKEKGGWERIKKISLILGIIVSLIVIVGAYTKYAIKDKPAVEQIKTPKTENKTTTEAKTNGDSSPAIITSGPNSPIMVNYDLNGEKNDIDSQIPPKVSVSRLIEDFEIELQQYHNDFLRAYEKIEDDYLNKKSYRSPLDSTIFSNAKLDVDRRINELKRKIQDILLRKFETEKFDEIKILSEEYKKYQSVVEKANLVKKEITKMERDPSRIIHLHDRINRLRR